MSNEEIKATARRMLEEVFPSEDVAALPELVAEDFVNHDGPPGAPQGRAGLAAGMHVLASAFSDQRWEMHQVLADGDTVVMYCTHSGEHTGEFMGIPATGRRFAYQQVHLVRFADGLGVEHWAVRDDATFMRQVTGQQPVAQPA